jgi:15-cis-phytoene desaturase
MGKRVAILGGGVAGLTAAHELAERGFQVAVYDRHAHPGGKARSFGKPNTGVDGRLDLPAEHGFRFFPGFYKHLPDTLRRIPFPNQPNGVFDNLVETSRVEMTRASRPSIVMPAHFPQSLSDVRTALHAAVQGSQLGIPPLEGLHFVDRLLTLASSCEQRLFDEYEYQSWWDFIGAGKRSAAYQQYLAIGLSRSLVACRAEEISARTGGTILLQLVFGMSTPDKPVDRLLNGPTNEVWIRPWVEYLRGLGVQYLSSVEVQHIHCAGDRISGVTVRNKLDGRTERIVADYYVAAMPVEVMRQMVTDSMRKADPQLAQLDHLRVAWMNGVQFYLRQDVPIVPGHVIYIDAPWALTSISQQQFWRNCIAQSYGDGSVGGILSVDVSNWDAPGILYGKAAKDCTPEQIKAEIWAQLQSHLNVGGAHILNDADLVGWNLDRDIKDHRCKDGRHTVDCVNSEPLLINVKGSWQHRPEAVTTIGNLFLAADYVRTYTDLATMEGADEAARRAVNGLLDASGSTARKCRLWPLQEPAVFTPLRALDRIVYEAHSHRGARPIAALMRSGVDQLRDIAGSIGLARREQRAAASSAPSRAATERRRTAPPRSGGKIKVAILGGGMSSIATAFHLTSTPELRAQYEVTVHQLGWRLGGKGASGRNAEHGNRIEEHGLHIWFGFYDNAFASMRQCYEELGRRATQPLATLEEAFKPCNQLVLYDQWQERWSSWPFTLPENPLRPGEASDVSFWDMAHGTLTWLWSYWKSLGARREGAPFSAAAPATGRGGLGGWFHELAREVEAVFETAEHAGEVLMLELACQLAAVRRNNHGGPAHHLSLLGRLLDEFRAWLWTSHVEPALHDDELRLFFTIFDTAASAIRGIIDDRVVERGFDSINGEDMRAWLSRHGAQPITVQGPLVRFMYDLALASVHGDVTQENLAAGVALWAALRLAFMYKGAFMFKMQAGMGDTVFAPFYEVLKRRGVHFKFFHSVTKLSLSDDRTSVDAIEVVPQVRLLVDDYDPLIPVKQLPCWPSEPRWEQIAGGQKLRKRGINLETTPNPLKHPPLRLRRGEDFDVVVLGIPVAALPPICAEILRDARNPAFKAMIEHSATAMTQAFQLWIQKPAKDLGWPYDRDAVMTAYVEPMDTYADMSHLIKRENWPARARVHSIAYFCGVLLDQPGDTQASTTARVRRNALQYLRENVTPVWPRAVQPSGGALDWNLLVDLDGHKGPKRFDPQFWRANFQPTERYVLSPAGSLQYRLRADESGYDNLFLTGDWIDNGGFNVGCVEAAVIAGMQAAQAITGVDHRIGSVDDDWLAEDREPESPRLRLARRSGGFPAAPSPTSTRTE